MAAQADDHAGPLGQRRQPAPARTPWPASAWARSARRTEHADDRRSARPDRHRRPPRGGEAMAERELKGLHNLEARQGLDPPAQARRPRRGLGHGQDLRPRPEGPRRALGRQAPRPLRGRPDARSTCGLRKLRGPHMKKSMPLEQFRTATQPVNVEDLEARFDAGAEVTPDASRPPAWQPAATCRSRSSASGEISKALTVHAHAFSAAAQREDRGRRRHRRAHSRTSRDAQDVPQLLPRPRAPEEAGLHRGDAAGLPLRRPRPGAGHRHRRPGAASDSSRQRRRSAS